LDSPCGRSSVRSDLAHRLVEAVEVAPRAPAEAGVVEARLSLDERSGLSGLSRADAFETAGTIDVALAHGAKPAAKKPLDSTDREVVRDTR